MQVTLPRQEHHIQDLLHTKTNHSRLHCIFAKLTDITMLLFELEVNFNNNMKQTISKDLKLFGMSFAHLLLSDLSMCDTFFPLAACTCISTNKKECILGKPNMRKNPNTNVHAEQGFQWDSYLLNKLLKKKENIITLCWPFHTLITIMYHTKHTEWQKRFWWWVIYHNVTLVYTKVFKVAPAEPFLYLRADKCSNLQLLDDSRQRFHNY